MSSPIDPWERASFPNSASRSIPGGECPSPDGLEGGVSGRGFSCEWLDGSQSNFWNNYAPPASSDFPGVVVDTREKESGMWTFPESVPVEVGTLHTGDYSVIGFEDSVVVERKALSDLIGCVGEWRDRFERELIRFRNLARAGLVVECESWVTIGERTKFSNINQRSVVHSIISWSVTYGFPVFLVPRPHAWKVCLSFLMLWWENRDRIQRPHVLDFYDTPLGKKTKMVLRDRKDIDVAERLATGL